jgi:UPF0755 protein
MNDLSGSRSGSSDSRRPPVSPKSAREMLQPHQVPPPPVRSRGARHPLIILLNSLIVLVVVALIGGGAFLWGKITFDQPGPLAEQQQFRIMPGQNLAIVAENLSNVGVVLNEWLFRQGVQFYGAAANLQAGEYLIPAGASMREVMDLFVGGDVVVYSVTIPEGFTSQQVVNRLMSDPNLTGDITDIPAEGTLLPDTYHFNTGDTRQQILDQMARAHDRAVADVWARRAQDLPIRTPEEFVILASIVEKETGIADERSRVASVFINRLNRGMRLQSDPTIIYGVWGGAGRPANEPIRQSQIDQRTPYNTYQIDGLPPGPIANPGIASLEAVANPSRTNDIFFVADGTGGHVFAETLEQHNRNVARWRQIEQQQRDAAEAAAAAAANPAPAITDPAAPVPVPAP